MRVTPDMKVADVLKINEHMIDAFTWISDSFEPLKNPTLSRDMSISVSVAQAARVGGVPLNEVLYVLNLTAGEDEKRLLCELEVRGREDSCLPARQSAQTARTIGTQGRRSARGFVDVFPRAQHEEDSRPESH